MTWFISNPTFAEDSEAPPEKWYAARPRKAERRTFSDPFGRRPGRVGWPSRWS